MRPIRDRLGFHRSNPELAVYAQHGLMVTWAGLAASQRDGVEHYLANQLRPLVGSAHPTATPVPVNQPW